MDQKHLENLSKALQCAELLAVDIRAAHKAACLDEPLLEIVLRDLIRESVAIKDRLAELESSLRQNSAINPPS